MNEKKEINFEDMKATTFDLSIDNTNSYANDLKEKFKSKHEELKKTNSIKGISPDQGIKSFKVPTPLKFVSIIVTIYMIITVILYILTYLGIPIMAI